MIVLGVDTVGATAGVALLGPRGLAASRELGERGRHAEALVPAVLDLLHDSAVSWDGLGLLAVNEGPGSFTGLRVGVSFVLGVADARSLPAVGVSCLDILAWACYDATGPETGTYVVGASDVRRGEVALARFRVGPEGPAREGGDTLIAVRDAGEPPPAGSAVAGDGAHLLWPEATGLLRWPGTGGERALATARLGLRGYVSGRREPPAPRYARPPEARPRRPV
jgi:tRNA threonylcarbamoyladenosine biosynthesis protein TsaB